jgi:hypothetical protein
MLEQYQLDRIRIIKEILPLFGDNFVLKGGTALNLYYGLPRYSEDVDLDSKTLNMNFINKLKRHPNFKKWDVRIKKDTDTSFKVMIDYGAASNLGSYPLKVEVSSRAHKVLSSKNSSYQTIAGVNVYNVEEIIAMKISAFNNRDKIRDLYDVDYLFRNYKDKMTKDILKQIYNKLSYSDFDELNTLLKHEAKQHKLVSINELGTFDDFCENLFMDVEEAYLRDEVEPVVIRNTNDSEKAVNKTIADE